jgi:hypothetical protein
MALHRQRIGVVHQLDMQMRRRRVAGVTDATDQVARATVSPAFTSTEPGGR